VIERAKSTASMVDQMSRAIAKGDGADSESDASRWLPGAGGAQAN